MLKLPEINDMKVHGIDIGIEVKPLIVRGSKKFSLPKPKKHRSSQTKKTFLSQSVDRRQNCTIRVSYRPSKALHIKNLEYIQKEGKDIDGGIPELYGSLTKEEYEKIMDEHNWRIIFSPETNDIPLETAVKNFIEKIEKHTGYKFNWVAANHYDTGKNHAHILINGIDQNGREVKFLPRDFVKNLMREYARDTCTSLAGMKTESQIENKQKEMINKNYFTQIDRAIKPFIQNDFSVSKNYLESPKSDLKTRRLDYLCKLGLATYSKQTRQYKLDESWQEKLQMLGRYNTFLDGFNYANCSKDKYTLHTIKDNGPIEGTVLKKYVRKNGENNFALVIKKEDESVSYVPLPFYPQDIFINDKVSISMNNKLTYINNLSRKK